MKQKLTGEQIDQFAYVRNDLPNYWGDKFTAWNSDRMKKVNGQLIAKKYNDIAALIKKENAKIEIQQDCIYISYPNGCARIGRDLLTDSFLLPLLKN